MCGCVLTCRIVECTKKSGWFASCHRISVEDADSGHTNTASARPSDLYWSLIVERLTSVGGRSHSGAAGDAPETAAAAALMSITPTMSSTTALALFGRVHHAVTTGCTVTGGVRSGGNGPGGKSSMAADEAVLMP